MIRQKRQTDRNWRDSAFTYTRVPSARTSIRPAGPTFTAVQVPYGQPRARARGLVDLLPNRMALAVAAGVAGLAAGMALAAANYATTVTGPDGLVAEFADQARFAATDPAVGTSAAAVTIPGLRAALAVGNPVDFPAALEFQPVTKPQSEATAARTAPRPRLRPAEPIVRSVRVASVAPLHTTADSVTAISGAEGQSLSADALDPRRNGDQPPAVTGNDPSSAPPQVSTNSSNDGRPLRERRWRRRRRVRETGPLTIACPWR